MTLSATPRRAGPFTGNGVTTAFPFTFKVFADTELRAVKTTVAGAESTLTLYTDYTVVLNADQDASPGGYVSYASLATDELLSLVGNVGYSQTLDLPTVGNFNPAAIEAALDRVVMQTQQLKEITDRAALVPIGGSTTSEQLVEAILMLGDLGDSLTTIAAYAASSTGNVTRFSGNGSQTVFTLPGDPLGENNTQIFVGGVYRQKDLYSVSGAVITFATAPAAGTNNIEVVWPKTFAIGVPEDGSVTTAKLADGAVTFAKTTGIAPRAVRVDVASVAGVVDLTASAPNTDDIRITGILTITGFTVAPGRVLRVTAGAAFTLANNASIVTNTGANLVFATGDTFILRATAANVVEVLGGIQVPAASDTVAGKVELATVAEAQAGSDTSRAVTSAGLGAVAFGVAQSWQNVTASRAINTVYTNSTGKTIWVNATTGAGAAHTATANIGGVSISGSSFAGSGSNATVCFPVPPGGQYAVQDSGSGAYLAAWHEMRA